MCHLFFHTFHLFQVIYFLNLIKNQHKCKICIDFGIPLKDLKNYVNADGELEFEHLLKDGKKLAKEKIRKIESYIDSINRTLQHINAQKTFQEPREIHSDPLVIFPQKLLSHGNTNVIISSMSPNTYKYDKVTLEFQIQT